MATMNLFALKYQLEKEHRPFRSDEVRRLPVDRRGVYALWLPSGEFPECLYVGISTTCVRQRLLSHLYYETNPDLRRELTMFGDDVQFSVAFTEDNPQTRELEARVVSDWQPRCNIRLR